MPDLELSLKHVSRAASSRNFLIIVPLVIAGSFSFGYMYYKQVNYQHNQAAAVIKTAAPASTSLPLAPSNPQPDSSLSVVGPTSTAPISGTVPGSDASQAQTSVKPTQASVNPKIQPDGSSGQLQSNVDTNNPKFLNIPLVQSLFNQ